jgi:hypothetical protein
MFAALSLNSFLEGTDLLLEAQDGLSGSLRAETMLLLLGSRGEALARASDMECREYGRVMGDLLKPILYSAAAVFVSPSRPRGSAWWHWKVSPAEHPH